MEHRPRERTGGSMRTAVLLSAAGCLGLATAMALPPGGAEKGAKAPAADAKAGPIAALVRQLGDDRYSRREAASKALEALGEKALPEVVEAAAASKDLEVRRRAGLLVRRVMARSQTSKSTGMTFVRIEAGLLHMGSPAAEKNRRGDEALHRVWVNRPFYLGAYEVTQEEYQKVMKYNPSWF